MSDDTAPSVAVIDYCMGNRRSVEKALLHVGARAVVTADHALIDGADALVLPGVGAFPRGADQLRAAGLDELIRDRVSEGVPLLGICLGMQLLFDHSVELGGGEGLGLIPGEVTALRSGERIPHIGWNDVRFLRESPLTRGLPGAGAAFYHVHSFAARPREAEDAVAVTDYGGDTFATIVAVSNVYGVQFHPEKSSTAGLALLDGFCALAAGRAAVGV